MVPKTGDVLISNRRASVDHDLSIVPAPPHLTCPSRDAAVAAARDLAASRQVDVWITEDQSHFLHLESYRDRRAAAGP